MNKVQENLRTKQEFDNSQIAINNDSKSKALFNCLFSFFLIVNLSAFYIKNWGRLVSTGVIELLAACRGFLVTS